MLAYVPADCGASMYVGLGVEVRVHELRRGGQWDEHSLPTPTHDTTPPPLPDLEECKGFKPPVTGTFFSTGPIDTLGGSYLNGVWCD